MFDEAAESAVTKQKFLLNRVMRKNPLPPPLTSQMSDDDDDEEEEGLSVTL